MKELWRTMPAPLKTALVAAVLGFIISIESWSTKSGSGGFECNYTNFGALLFGAIAIVAAVVSVFAVMKAEEPSTLLYVLTAASLAVGVLHILRGVGTVGGYCNSL